MSVLVPFLTDEEIEDEANAFLNENQPEGDIPVLIEEIIEFNLGLEIRPIRGLKVRFGFEGAISHDMMAILVDEESMLKFPNRYRFTLAHEISHSILHGAYIESLTFKEMEDWKRAVLSIDPKTYSRMERQAYTLAGHILIPRQQLILSCQEANQLAQEHGIDFAEMGESAVSHVAGHIAKNYRVSSAVMEWRINAVGIF